MNDEKTVKKFEEPELQVIHLTEKDIITTSGDPYDDPDQETEIIRY